MSYVPRSPRRATRLRAVVDGVVAGAPGEGGRVLHAIGPVRDMSTSGMFVEAAAKLPVGSKVAVVPLLGELDGERLPAEIARVADRGLAVRFIGLDPDVRQRLRRTFASDDVTAISAAARITPSSSSRPVLQAVPEDAPVFLLTDEPPALEIVAAPVRDIAATMRGTIDRLESQLLEASRMKHVILEENGRLKRETMALQARLSVALSLRMRVDEDLAEAHATIEDLARGEDALIKRIQTLEELLQRALINAFASP